MLSDCAVLFVDDDTTTQEYMKMFLEYDTKEVFVASDGEEGLKIYNEKKPDIVLTDINMPNKDGLFLVREIRKIDKKTPIIIMSAYDNSQNLLKAINLGTNGFITKPIDTNMLKEKLIDAREYIELVRSSDIADSAKRLKSLYKLAHYDKLTEIPNRYLFEKQLDISLKIANRQGDSIAIFFIDLDRFKSINDTYGHNAGDYVLKTFVKNIKSVIRQEDIFGRRSGDEFLIYIKNANKKRDVALLAKKIIEASKRPIKYFGDEVVFSISCSIGISIYPKDSSNVKDLIHFADLAMYKAKRSPKTGFKFYNKKKI